MKQASVKNPILFIGMPRSGTTIVQEAFSAHEDLGWLSNYTAHFPNFPRLTAIHRLFGELQGQRSQGQKLSPFNRFFPRPAETYGIWEILFGRKFLYSFLKGAVPSEKEKVDALRYIATLLHAQNKPVFCAKLTGPPRITFLSEIFPDAYFVDVVRDPRAVIASLMVDKDDFWERKGGIQGPFWSDALSEEDLEVWKSSDNSPVVLAVLQWVAVYERTKYERELRKVNYHKLTYEDFTRNPQKNINELRDFCGLKKSIRLDAYVDSVRYSSKNQKFLDIFSKQEIQWIETIAADQMHELGYQSEINEN